MSQLKLVFLLAFVITLCAAENPLASLKKIYVGSMGQSDESQRFRILLEGELTKEGFISVDTAEKADGILTGTMSVMLSQGTSIARATVVLKTPEGNRLWDGDFQPHLHLGRLHGDTVKARAEDVSKALRKDVASAAKHK